MKLQNKLINKTIEQKSDLTVFLNNGVRLQGVITDHDDECIYLERDGVTQLVYKHGVSTVMPPMENG